MKAERSVFAKSKVTDQNKLLQSTDSAPLTTRNSLVRAICFATIAAATLGWLWLIAWIALKLT